MPVVINLYISTPVSASDYHFGRIGEGDAAVVAAILLNANRKQPTIINPLPLFHAFIQPTHGRILEINEVAFVRV